jgi:hypothetical protein
MKYVKGFDKLSLTTSSVILNSFSGFPACLQGKPGDAETSSA